jgi:hypothetical protein
MFIAQHWHGGKRMNKMAVDAHFNHFRRPSSAEAASF